MSTATESGASARPRHEAALAEALRLATLGYRVFPLSPGSKIPTEGSGGCKDATSDVDQIEAWWHKQPRANIGLSTEGLFVVDDDSDGKWLDGRLDLAADLSAAPMQRTPRGGKHWVFRGGAEFRNSTSAIAHKIDTRGNGGYIVVSPSRVDGKGYEWINPLDVPPEHLPDPPTWLVGMYRDNVLKKRDHSPSSKAASEIPKSPACNGSKISEGQRNGTLASLAGSMRRRGMSPDAIVAALLTENAARCQPPLPDDEVRRIAASVGRYEPQQAAAQDDEKPVDYKPISCADLMAAEFNVRFLVDWILTEGQPCILAGPQKSLKTSILTDLALSLCTAGYFLGRFKVPEAVSVGMMTGESGLPTNQDAIRRISSSAGIDPTIIRNFYLTDRVPRFDHLHHTDALKAFLFDHEIQVLLIDPLYMAIDGDNQANLAAQGEQLRRVNELCSECGATLVLCHHSKKETSKIFSPLDLSDLSGAGHAEWARQWILLSRREPYTAGTGSHRLWLNVGGSFGHGGLWGLDVEEGRLSDHGGRRWDVSLLDHEEVHEASERQREAAKQAKFDQAIDDGKRRVVDAMVKFPDGETAKKIRLAARMNTTNFEAALAALVADGDVIECDILKRNRATPYTGYKLSS